MSSASHAQTPPPVIVVSGPSGAGKSTLLKRIFAAYPSRLGWSVSHTTRSPRAGEQHGREYHFIPRAKFEAMISEGGFLEHAEFGGNLYGTSLAAVESVSAPSPSASSSVHTNGAAAATTTTTTAVEESQKIEKQNKDGTRSQQQQTCILDIEIQGVQQLRRHSHLGPLAKVLFVKPPSLAVLEQRLRSRATDSDADIARRLEQARREIEFADEDVRTGGGVFDAVVTNDDLEACWEEVKGLVGKWMGDAAAGRGI